MAEKLLRKRALFIRKSALYGVPNQIVLCTILCTHVTIIMKAPERLFSTTGHILKSNRLSLKPTNFEGCLFLKKNIGTFKDDCGPCPNEFEAPNREDCPPSELCTEDYSDSECSDIVISSDDES